VWEDEADKERAMTGALLASLEEAFDRRSWHGTNLRGAIRGLSLDQAAWRPGPARHNIWELVLHAAYWKYAVRRRLTGDKRGTFPLKGVAGRPMVTWRVEARRGHAGGQHRAARGRPRAAGALAGGRREPVAYAALVRGPPRGLYRGTDRVIRPDG
jgi:hypothetical protein